MSKPVYCENKKNILKCHLLKVLPTCNMLNIKLYFRASINFQTQEVPDFLHLRFGSPTGKSRKSHFFRAATGCPLFRKTKVLISVSHRIIMIYNSFRCVLKTPLLLKIQSHLFGKPELVCRTLEKASTLVKLRIRFKAQRREKIK